TIPGAINIRVDRSEGSKGVVNHDKSNCRIERGSERLTSSGWFHSGSVIEPGASSTRRTFRDFHNDEPKSVACTTDMLLAAITASVRPIIKREEFQMRKDSCKQIGQRCFSRDDAGKRREVSEKKIERARFSKFFPCRIKCRTKEIELFSCASSSRGRSCTKASRQLSTIRARVSFPDHP
ncbi:unnamed protein product, partial [Heterotrigona itama]